MGDRVFVSSTCYDLLDVRAELELHLRSMGLIPIMSDRVTSDFAVGGRGDSIDTCLVNLRSSDVVLLILSQRYGPALPPPYGPLSATHVEYEEAVKLDKPIHVYVRDQLLADYHRWRRDPKTRLEWIRDAKEHPILDLLKEREDRLRAGQTGPNVPSNWVWSFRDSVELKERVSKDLQRQSRVATLQRLLDARAVPALNLVNQGTGQQGARSAWSFVIFNAGAAAFDIHWTSSADATVREVLPLPPNSQSGGHTINFPTPAIGASPVAYIINLEYRTALGLQLTDTFSLQVWLTPQGIRFQLRHEKKSLSDGPQYTLA